MKILLNNKEISHYLVSFIEKCVYTHVEKIQPSDEKLSGVVQWANERKNKGKELNREKVYDKIVKAIEDDLKTYVSILKSEIAFQKNRYHKTITKHSEYFIQQFGEEFLIANYKKSNIEYFCKTVGLQIDSTAEMIRRGDFKNNIEDCLLRNTVGNENIIVNKIDNNLPFWFIDSGYTNFVESNKKWHRITRNHLHFNNQFIAPVDRLKNFKEFPRPWRKDGEKILIVEPGEFAASIMHVDPKSWTEQVSNELKKYTDRPIEIRSKINKKTRTSLYQTLVDGDYYCTVSINSNSAVESVWAGIPAITLDKHVSNAVTRTSLSQINDLYYGPLGDWLAWLSYCQFTYDELMDGTALDIIKEHHGV
jgi:hypothetical protein